MSASNTNSIKVAPAVQNTQVEGESGGGDKVTAASENTAVTKKQDDGDRLSNKTDTKKPKTSCSFKLFLQYTPFVNNLYDLFFDDVPSLDNIKELLNLIGLIDALMLGISFSVITAVDFGDNTDADARFMIPSDDDSVVNGYNELYDSGDHWRLNSVERGAPSAHFAENNMLGIAWLFNSLVLVLIAYFDIVNKKFEGSTPGRSARLLKEWWNYGRFVIVASGVFAFNGIVAAMAASVPLIYINFPDYYVEKHGRMTSNTNYPYEMAQTYLDYTWVTLWVALLMVGVATIFTYREMNKQDRTEEEVQSGQILSQSAQSWERFFTSDPVVKEYFDDVREEYVDIFISERFDFTDRKAATDTQLSAMGIQITGHRIKLLQLFATEESLT
mmetsp:Transcript_2499/g.4540  ORF Transcript_2499/g.4540 Transcript_2499/m.4540 type:complete len:387 (-) Transcript_2499:102-1262(-)